VLDMQAIAETGSPRVGLQVECPTQRARLNCAICGDLPWARPLLFDAVDSWTPIKYIAAVEDTHDGVPAKVTVVVQDDGPDWRGEDAIDADFGVDPAADPGTPYGWW
jgi:hypothetical protein